MDDMKPQSEQIEDWMRNMLTDGAADIGMWQNREFPSAKVERSNNCQLSVDSHGYSGNLSQPQLMQTSAGCNSASLMSKRDQESLSNVMQHNDQTTMQKIFETKGGAVLERAHPRLQMSALHQPQNLIMADQFKPGNQTQQAMPFGTLQASPESSQVDLTNSMDWVNPLYQKILQMKEMYLSQFISLYQKILVTKRQATDAETMNKLEKSRHFVERTIKLLKISRSELMQLKMERACQLVNDVMKYISQSRPRNSLYPKQSHQVDVSGNHIEAPHIQQRENHLQFISTAPTSLPQPLRPGGALGMHQSSFNIGSSSGLHNKVDAASSFQYNLMRPTQQWASQGNVAPSPRRGNSQIGFDLRALPMFLRHSGGVAPYNNLATSQQTVAPPRNIFNSLDYSASPIGQLPVSMPPLQNNQQDQAMRRQKMKQPVQQLMAEKNKQQMLQKRNEDTKLRRFLGINQKWSPVLPPNSPYAISPQNSQQSSSQIELKDLSLKFPKSATPSLSSASPSLSSASPSALPSPLTPLTPMTPMTPSSVPVDPVKSPVPEETGKLAKNPAAASQPPLQDTTCDPFAPDTHRSNRSCMLKGSTSSGDKQSSQNKGDSLKRLVEVVKSVSSKALHATLTDIDAVTSLTDRIAINFRHGKPTKVIFHDLADDVISNCDKGTASLEHSAGVRSGLKRGLDTVALNDLTDYSEFCASGGIKRMKTEPNYLLLEEIKEINQKLIEIVVDVMTLEDVSRAGSDEGTLIRCSYIPVGFSGIIKTPNASKLMFPHLILEVIVSADYPNSSPTVLEKVPSGFCDAEEGKYLWMKAKANFILSLRKISQPISVRDMAEAWDVSAREVVHELAEQMGGGSFTSDYGNWENCAVSV